MSTLILDQNDLASEWRPITRKGAAAFCIGMMHPKKNLHAR